MMGTNYWHLCKDGTLRKAKSTGGVIYGVTNHLGVVAKRTKRSHPYGYDPVCWFYQSHIKATDNAYHDRMQSWDWGKFDRAFKEHLANGVYSMMNPNMVELFLRDYYDDPELVLVCIEESCNVSSGFPVFWFSWKSSKK